MGKFKKRTMSSHVTNDFNYGQDMDELMETVEECVDRIARYCDNSSQSLKKALKDKTINNNLGVSFTGYKNSMQKASNNMRNNKTKMTKTKALVHEKIDIIKEYQAQVSSNVDQNSDSIASAADASDE